MRFALARFSGCAAMSVDLSRFSSIRWDAGCSAVILFERIAMFRDLARSRLICREVGCSATMWFSLPRRGTLCRDLVQAATMPGDLSRSGWTRREVGGSAAKLFRLRCRISTSRQLRALWRGWPGSAAVGGDPERTASVCGSPQAIQSVAEPFDLAQSLLRRRFSEPLRSSLICRGVVSPVAKGARSEYLVAWETRCGCRLAVLQRLGSLRRSRCALVSGCSLVKGQQPTASSMHPDGTPQCHPGLAFGCGPHGQSVCGQGNLGRKDTDYEIVDARVKAGLAWQGGNDGGPVEDSSRASELDELVCKERLKRFRR